MQVEQKYLTEEHIIFFQQRMEMIINIIRVNRSDVNVARHLANEDEDANSTTDGGLVDQTDDELVSIMDQCVALRASYSETGTHSGTPHHSSSLHLMVSMYQNVCRSPSSLPLRPHIGP